MTVLVSFAERRVMCMKIRIAMFILTLIAGSLVAVMLVGVHNSVNNHTSVRIAINEKWGLHIPSGTRR